MRCLICCVVMLVIPGTCQYFTGINSLIREYFGRTSQEASTARSLNTTPPLPVVGDRTEHEHSKSDQLSSDEILHLTDPGKDFENAYPVVHAALPRGVAAYPIPLRGSDHELAFNVTWHPPTGPPVRGYSIEVQSVTDTVDCHSNLCYEYNLPGDALWSIIPTSVSPVTDGCAVRPGCAYQVKVIAHPWDGHTVANINVELDECVAGVCSCAHAPRLPRPSVAAETIALHDDTFVNVTWTLPPPLEPLRLPPRLRKQYYYVSIGEQIVSDAHPAPWYNPKVSRRVDTFGFVSVPEGVHWLVFPLRKGGEDRTDLQDNSVRLAVDVKSLVTVNLIDERGCVGPPGNATAHDPSDTAPATFKTFMIWASVCCASALMMIVVVAFSARAVKRVLRVLRPADPLEPLSVRPVWFQFSTQTDRRATSWEVVDVVHEHKLVYLQLATAAYSHVAYPETYSVSEIALPIGEMDSQEAQTPVQTLA